MKELVAVRWVKITLFNLCLVACLGVLLRFKIAFEFPFFDQKNIHHAHSNFALYGWISLIIMVLMTQALGLKDGAKSLLSFKTLFLIQLVSAYGMLFSFFVQGYGTVSTSFSILSLLNSICFCVYFFRRAKAHKDDPAYKWFSVALIFNVISALGTFFLSYKMLSHKLDQNMYLALEYWILHFQYNGWMFFACLGLFIHYLHLRNKEVGSLNKVFWLFALSCLPAYGLSVLWLKLPLYFFIPVVLASLCQFTGLLLLMDYVRKNKFLGNLGLELFPRLLLAGVGTALFIKVCLQLGSTIPAMSQLAFGFRPIVIAYLHLVLLAFTTVFLITYCVLRKLISPSRFTFIGLSVFVIGVFLNELVLGIQGVAALDYVLVPFVNEALFGVALLILIGLLLVNIANFRWTKQAKQ
ncbi:MAG: hypothetical protein ACYC1Q_00125 [Bacteroidia bacterium]